jgi:hypothetical protein
MRIIREYCRVRTLIVRVLLRAPLPFLVSHSHRRRLRVGRREWESTAAASNNQVTARRLLRQPDSVASRTTSEPDREQQCPESSECTCTVMEYVTGYVLLLLPRRTWGGINCEWISGMRLLQWGASRHSSSPQPRDKVSPRHLARGGSALSSPVRVLCVLAAAALLQTAGNFRWDKRNINFNLV